MENLNQQKLNSTDSQQELNKLLRIFERDYLVLIPSSQLHLVPDLVKMIREKEIYLDTLFLINSHNCYFLDTEDLIRSSFEKVIKVYEY